MFTTLNFALLCVNSANQKKSKNGCKAFVYNRFKFLIDFFRNLFYNSRILMLRKLTGHP